MVMIGLYAKRYCCLAIDCRVIYKKRFFGQDVCFFHHLLINVFFRFGLVHFKRQKNIFKKSHLHGIPNNRTFAHRHNPNVSGWYY